MDMCSVNGKKILLVVDEFSTFVFLHRFNVSPSAAMIVSALKNRFAQTGFPHRLRSDGEGIFTSVELADFYKECGIIHELSSVENPTSNTCWECHVGLANQVLY